MGRSGLLICSCDPQPKARFAPLILAYGCGLNKEPSEESVGSQSIQEARWIGFPRHGRVLLSRAYLRFTGQIKCNRSNAAEETKGVHDILFALPCLSKPVALSCYPLVLLKALRALRSFW